MKIFILFLAMFPVFLPGAEDVGEWFSGDGKSFWKQSAGSLGKMAAPCAFQWGNRAKTQLRYVRKAKEAECLSWGDIPLCEMVIQLNGKTGNPENVTLSIFNRGDGGSLSKQKLEAMRTASEARMQEVAGAGNSPKKERTHLGNATLHSLLWTVPEEKDGKKKVKFRLVWCVSNRGAEYLTLKITAPGVQEEPFRNSLHSGISKKDLPSRVQTSRSGVRYLDIPMVDQGSKGYCAAASVARILRYYGSDADMNQVAQLLGTDAQAGTTYDNIIKNLEREGNKLKVRPEVWYTWRDFDNPGRIQKFVSRYNKFAKNAGKPAVKMNSFCTVSGRQRVLDVSRMLNAMSPEIIRKMRLQDRELPRFRKKVRESIDKGIPVLWLIPGHIRLITGYHAEKDVIQYSDSWGSAHEREFMPTEDAFVITVRALTLDPH